MPRYQYKPLGEAQLRILKLFPGEFDDPLWGRLDHCRFDPPHTLPTYEAISYAWGNQDNPETLTLVGNSLVSLANLTLRPDTTNITREHSLHIGPNLASALRDLRGTSECRIIWCDAVCINQHDLPERAAQVQRMADIYRHADRVVVWLAPQNDQVARALHILKRYGSNVGYDVKRGELYTHKGMNTTYMREDYLLPLSSYDWQCVSDLLNLPWFTRLWVRQEITLANDASVLTSGRHQLLWPRFRSAVAYLNFKMVTDETVVKASQKPVLAAGFQNAMKLIRCKRWMRHSLDIVNSMDRCQCADPRDHIYGVLGLQTDFDIPVDYTKTAKEVYTDWVLRYCERHSQLNILGLCEMAGTPSWVPNVAKPRSLQLWNVRACSSSRTKAVFNNLTDQTFNVLATRCGTIAELTTAMANQPDPEVIRETFKSWICQLFPRRIQSHDKPKIDELATTVSGGRAVENFDSGRFNTMDVKNALLPDTEHSFSSSSGQMKPKLFTQLSRFLPGAAVLATKDGHFGLGSGAAQIGDEIFVLLGCSYAMAMRSVEGSKYEIISPCYFPHLSRGEALLGHLPDGWKGIFGSAPDNVYFVAPDGSHTFDDPRIKEDLPPGWEQDEHEGTLRWARFEDEKWRLFDPRLTPEKLEARGVKLEMITVV